MLILVEQQTFSELINLPMKPLVKDYSLGDPRGPVTTGGGGTFNPVLDHGKIGHRDFSQAPTN